MKKLGFGLMRLPVLDKEDVTTIDEAQLIRMVDTFMEQGFTYFDTAYPYHKKMSECAIRKALVERYPRESFVLADKMPTFLVEKPEDYPAFFNEQLEKCGVEYFDYYLMHTLDRELYAKTKQYGGFDFARKMKAEGKIKHMGFSFHDTADILEQILTDQPDVEFVQLQINYIDWESEKVQSRRCYEVARKHGKQVIIMEPVRGGALANVPKEAEAAMKECRPQLSVPSWAIRFAASLDGVMMVLSGMSNMEQLTDNLSYMKEFAPLDEKELAVVWKAAEIIRSTITIPCTGCRYCVDGCPQNIPIPSYFTLYNRMEQTRDKGAQKNEYKKLTGEGGYGKASDCIGCKQCEEHCPQHIDITGWLKKAAESFEG
ncbi:MAG: aldo/keto reductase [Lachnospiraceae bacterium]|nr:aldo/keto reductase [Lachnospiraceae bacterium]